MSEFAPVLIPVLTEYDNLLSKPPFLKKKIKFHISIYIHSKFERLFLEKSNDIFNIVGDLEGLIPFYFIYFGKRQFP